MKATRLYDSMFLPSMLWMSWASKLGEMLLASAQVITHRGAMMRSARGRPSPAQAGEFTLMGAEKLEAFSLSALHAMQGWTQLWLQLAGGAAWPAMGRRSASLARLSERILRPVHGKATANARRLAAKQRAAARRRIAHL
jgi:hypothetical protein